MTSEITAKGQTVDEAVQSALQQLGAVREQVDIQVLDQGKKGFLGLFGARPAVVKVALKGQQEEKEEQQESLREAEAIVEEPAAQAEMPMKADPVEEAKLYLEAVIREMGVAAQVETHVKGRDITFTLAGEQVALLIGKRGSTLNSLQYLAQLVANRHTKSYINVTVDAENYREKRRGTLESLAHRLAKQAANTRRKVVLEPMPSFERKVIHQALSHHPYVKTGSEGAEPHRHVVIFPR
ncbi:RNA-binding cell elongation regulator Jag/EloR [Ectobacillus ponti]|uniref:RNA-binding protein KhpB n=1 Tax=Ectobacillus ponti TaxID=2961894 RepID=A0AA42BT43_9BACI|nr:protein jag [Ectobacillus ponti]